MDDVKRLIDERIDRYRRDRVLEAQQLEKKCPSGAKRVAEDKVAKLAKGLAKQADMEDVNSKLDRLLEL